MTRSFIALEQDASQQQLLADIIEQGKQFLPDIHWVHPSGIHLTLAFLGELDDRQLAQALDAVQEVAQKSASFAYRLAGPGTFGEMPRPRVLWMGVSEPSGSLNEAHRLLKHALEQRSFLTDKRPFSPHLTLARVGRPLTSAEVNELQQLFSRYQSLPSIYHVTQLQLMKSELLPSGARYTCLNAASLQNR